MNQNAIYISYGETFSFPGTLDDDMDDVESITLYVGKEGPSEPLLAIQGVIMGLNVDLQHDKIEIPVGEYKYQIKVVYTDGRIEKFPEMTRRRTELPDFIVTEAIDEVEETV